MDINRFAAHAYMQKRYDRVSRGMAFKAADKRAMNAWRRRLSLKLKELTGYDTMRMTALKPAVTERESWRGLVRERVEIWTEPGIVMPLYVLYEPASSDARPAIIAAHGHGSGGKNSPAGRDDIPEIAETIRVHNYAYGVDLARAGYVVFCPDARGFGERQEQMARSTGRIMDHSCTWLNNMAFPLGQTVTGMWAWDLHRLVDYIMTRPDCRGDRIGCVGLSGGGLQTLWATALDERIKCAVVSGYFYGYKQALLDLHWNCSCNYVPHLYEYADMGDIGALIAPRPLMIETGDTDYLNGAGGLANVKSQVSITRKAYRLCGCADRLKHSVQQGGHQWYGVGVKEWLAKWL